MNSAIINMENQDGPGQVPLLTGGSIGNNLLLMTMKKQQDFWQICRVCNWLRASRGSPVDLNDELEAVVAPRTVKVVESIFQALLSNSPKGTSKGAMDCGLDAPLRTFFLAVADQIRTEFYPDINIVDEQPSAQEADLDTEDSHPVADCSDVTGTSKTAMSVEGHKTSSERVEPPEVDAKLESSMLAAAVGVMSALVSELKSTIKEDFTLVDPSIDPSHYTTQVQLVSEKVWKSIQAKMKDVLVVDIFIKANGARTPEDDAQLKFHLLSGSKQILQTIIDSIMSILQSADENVAGLNGQFQRSVLRCLIMYTLSLSQFSHHISDVSSGEMQSSRRRGLTVRMPKISLRKLGLKVILFIYFSF